MRKKILLLGGSRYLIPVIKTCHDLGYYVITCDYLPHNDAHKYADEYHNVSVMNLDAVLKLAQELKIDGITSFACDAGAVAAAYVAEKMHLPFNGPFESVKILQNKGLFRQFLLDNGFNSPHAKSYKKGDDISGDLDYFEWPVIVKPVDSAGSRGVTKVDSKADLPKAIEYALSEAHCDHYIIEDFLTFEGFHSSADYFTVNGKLVFSTFSDQLFDQSADNPYAPTLIIFPTTMQPCHQTYLSNELQRLMTLLNMDTGIYNIETCVGKNGKPYIMEVSPRGGGCKIAEMQTMATGIDLIKADVQKAVNDKLAEIKFPVFNKVWCEYVLHNTSANSGKFVNIQIDPIIKEKYIKEINVSIRQGEFVEPFTGGNKSIGDMILQFNSREELNEIMSKSNDWLKIILE